MKLVLSEEQLRDGVRRMAADISTYYGSRAVTVVGVLTGSIIMLADLIRELKMPLRVALVQARSYRGRSMVPGPLVVSAENLPDLAHRDVLLLDDIFDTGHTLLELVSQIDDMNPASVRSAVLLRKHGRQQVSLVPDWIGFEIPDEFVVGYGLDYDDMYRHLPYLAALEPADLADRELPA